LIEVIGFGTIDFYSNVDVEQLFTKMYKNADSELEKIKKELLDLKVNFIIRVSEYVEGDIGFYFDNREGECYR
jgi:hypothetical protein